MFEKMIQKIVLKKILKEVNKMLQGKKTIIVGVAMILYAASASALGYISIDEAIRVGLEGAGFITLRLGIGGK